jgi:hypothetical protein
MDDLPQRSVIRGSSHRIHNPFTSEKLATLGRVLYLSPGTSVLDLARYRREYLGWGVFALMNR